MKLPIYGVHFCAIFMALDAVGNGPAYPTFMVLHYRKKDINILLKVMWKRCSSLVQQFTLVSQW